MDSHSCCEIEKPEEQSSASCDIMEMNASSFDSCGCIHELANNVDDSILTSIKIDFSASLIIDNAVSDNSNDNLSFSKNFSSFRFNTHSIPIYISVSSYLI